MTTTRAGTELREFWRMHRNMAHGVALDEADALDDDIAEVEREARGRPSMASCIEPFPHDGSNTRDTASAASMRSASARASSTVSRTPGVFAAAAPSIVTWRLSPERSFSTTDDDIAYPS